MIPMMASAGGAAAGARAMQMVHLPVADFALGAVTHHWWALVRGKASLRLPADCVHFAGR